MAENKIIPADIQADADKLYPVNDRVFSYYPFMRDDNEANRNIYIQGRLDERAKSANLSRVEVIGNGREYVNMDIGKVELSFQDDNKTLKVFVEKSKK